MSSKELLTEELVYKSGELIEAQYNLSTAAQKVAATLISKIDPEKKKLPVFDMSVIEYARLMGMSKQSAYELIDKTTLELKQIVITLRKPDSRSFTRLGMFRECHYDDDEKRVQFEFERRLEIHLRDFAGNFTKYQIKQIKRLTSRYAIRLYEILRKAHPIHTISPVSHRTVDLDSLRAMLGVRGKTYKQFPYFRRSVLNVAAAQIEAETDLRFTFEPIRKGRSVGSIRFSIYHNERFVEMIQDNPAPEVELSLNDRLKKFFPKNILGLVVKEFDAERIERNLAYTIEQIELGETEIKNKGKYLLKAIKEDYAKPPEPKDKWDSLLDRSWDDDFELIIEE